MQCCIIFFADCCHFQEGDGEEDEDEDPDYQPPPVSHYCDYFKGGVKAICLIRQEVFLNLMETSVQTSIYLFLIEI